MKTLLLLSLLLLSSLSFGDVTYTESKTYIGTIRYYTIRSENKVCVYDVLVEKQKILNKYCFNLSK